MTAGSGLATAAPAAAADPVQIQVLGNRADLLSGGDALVRVALPAGATSDRVRVQLDQRDVTGMFAFRSNGRYEGLVTGLKLGPNTLRATLRRPGSDVGATLTLTNHPIGGPVFSGPQVQPWECDTAAGGAPLGPAVDAKCNTPTVYRWFYRSTDAARGFQPYDAAQPPVDLARTTTDTGAQVPYVVRVEYGVINRGIYSVAVLADPSGPWRPWSPQRGWNGKLLYTYGGGSAPHHVQGGAPSVLDDATLSRGFMVASGGLNVLGNNNNDVVSAESTMMLKEHVTEAYGPIRYTIGEGCSGGSIQQHLIAANYPGLLDGLLPECSYPDVWTTSEEVTDCHLLLQQFARADLGLTREQIAAISGQQVVRGEDYSICQGWENTFYPVGDPSRAENCAFEAGDPRVYDPVTNPGGVRCSPQDYQKAIWGERPRSVWTDVERRLGHGFARRPIDNVGVQYGLEALRAGTITPRQFVQLNLGVGGVDIDGNDTPTRMAADPGALQIAYSSGRVTNGRALAQVPIIDLRGSANLNDIHSDYHSYELRARLDKANGSHANQVIWSYNSFGNYVGIFPQAAIRVAAITTMDRWLTGIEADTGNRSTAYKVLAHKPRAAVDSCWPDSTLTEPGRRVVDPDYAGPCGAAFPHYGDAREVAGEGPAGDILKCQLVPVRPADYPGFTDQQLTRLQGAFPSGVCDYSRRGVDQQPSQQWLTYRTGPGGTPLGMPPTSTPTAASGPSADRT
ncbi:MAG TPA: DUF6351 family protein [Mycobacteriales bacterium]|nr:DUF6351 family protein [Mycobacteriales bacterium]